MVTVTFNLSTEVAARLAVAYGAMLGLQDEDLSDPENPVYTPRSANMAEFKAKIANVTLNAMYAWERQQLRNAVTVDEAEIT